MSSELDSVRQVAAKDKKERLKELLQDVSVKRLMMAFEELNLREAMGVDGVTWQEYERELVGKIRELQGRVQ